ncbi:hypothetical protein L596_014001 [Steinernema carpocapsae]|uniref:Uncharacterized protein n=1 Tax=Steinernema carpocapsae TaxID=34508 RepID=A0A4U5NBD3_STECR|nr:hypothetical protein L596_014001 [Steinernema carpocapsae]
MFTRGANIYRFVLATVLLSVGVQIFCQGAELPSSPIVLQVLSELQQQPSTQRPRGVHESLPEIEEETEHPESTPSGLLAPMSGANFFASGGQPDIGHVSFSGLSEPCSIGSIVEVVINAHGDNSRGSVVVEASAPSARLMKCPVVQKANSYMATFTPNEVDADCLIERARVTENGELESFTTANTSKDRPLLVKSTMQTLSKSTASTWALSGKNSNLASTLRKLDMAASRSQCSATADRFPRRSRSKRRVPAFTGSSSPPTGPIQDPRALQQHGG